MPLGGGGGGANHFWGGAHPNIFELSSISDYIRPDSKKLYPVHPIRMCPISGVSYYQAKN